MNSKHLNYHLGWHLYRYDVVVMLINVYAMMNCDDDDDDCVHVLQIDYDDLVMVALMNDDDDHDDDHVCSDCAMIDVIVVIVNVIDAMMIVILSYLVVNHNLDLHDRYNH